MTRPRGGVRNVARLGGQVVSMSEEKLKRELGSTLREARAAGYDAKVWGYSSGCDLIDEPGPPAKTAPPPPRHAAPHAGE